MGTAYQVRDAKDSRKWAEFLAREGPLLLPMLDPVTRTEAAVDEVIEVVGRADALHRRPARRPGPEGSAGCV